LIAAAFAGWQFVTVERNYQNNWSALFYTGGSVPIPPDLRAHTWVFPSSSGYDGQMYRYLAHDPFLQRTEHLFIDDTALRARRILVPGAAWLLALGRQSHIDAAYIAVVWMFVLAGAYWVGRILQTRGLSAAWAILFLALPATEISADRLTIDISTTALSAGLIWYWEPYRSKGLYVVSALLCLSRETGFILWGALVAACLLNRRPKQAAVFATAALPAVLWSLFVQAHTPASGINAIVLLPYWLGLQPWAGPFIRLTHPVEYVSPWKFEIQLLDVVAISGMLAGFAGAIKIWWDRKKDLRGLVLLLFVLSVTAVSAEHFWDSAYGYARPFSPLLLLVGLEAAFVTGRRWLWLLPCLLIFPRLLLQIGPQILGIIGIRIST
jgi:hypothetical protein